jgi:hypothetical protein
VAITFQKRQKEMKRMEKQRAKAERRAQKKLARRDHPDRSGAPVDSAQETSVQDEPLDHGTP